MQRSISQQLALFPALRNKFPSTRYQGSKNKIVDWIWEQIKDLDFMTCLDAFGGTGVVAYRFKQAGKHVTYNDLYRFNYYFGSALIENNNVNITTEEVNQLLVRHSKIEYPSFIKDKFAQIYFTDEENAWIDQTFTNIRNLSEQYKFSLAFFALCQSCIIKRPYNLFHRKNLYIRLAEVKRSFGNKTTWDKPFSEWFCNFLEEANQAVFDNGYNNSVLNLNAMEVPGDYDLVYIDTPYISNRGVGVDYLSFYHFLEGLTMYDEWEKHIDYKSKHRRLKHQLNDWTDKNRIFSAFDKLFEKFQDSIIVVSYRSDGIPSESEIISLLKRYKRNVRVSNFGNYKYVLSKNKSSKEILLIGS